MPAIKIGIIGGSGIKTMDVFQIDETKTVSTIFGPPSSTLLCGKIKGTQCVVLSRHGHSHEFYPSSVNYRANILALKNEGCTHILATTACGSLQEDIKPGQFVVIDQFIDRTTKRASTFYDGSQNGFKGVCHIPMRNPFSKELCKIVSEACQESNVSHHSKGTVVSVEGPRFSTLAESNLFRSWNASIINMTTVPEVILANELGILYSAIGLVTDYDCWRSEEESVDVASVMKVMATNGKYALNVIVKAVELISKMTWDQIINDSVNKAKNSVM